MLGKGPTIAQTDPPYPPAFRAEAGESARTGGKGGPRLAHDLGVAERAWRGWMKRADSDAGRGQSGASTTAEREALQRLRRENRVLRQKREIDRPYIARRSARI